MYDFNLLKSLYEIHSPSGQEKKLRKFVRRMARQRGAECVTDNHGNLYVTKGEADTYPCICAHLDQVQDDHSKDFTVYKQDDVIFAYSAKSKAQQGLGADDKNGIWIALELLEQLDVLKCAFFVGEEVGCVGSSKANMEFFKDVRYCIQPDRKSGHDLITNISGDLCSKEFLEAIDYAEYGYKEETGLMTDVETLRENGVGVSCINISCGYYAPHTDEECTSWSELCNARDFALHICTKLLDVYPHKYEPTWSGYGYGGYGYGKSWGKGYNYGNDYCDWYDDYELDSHGNWKKKSQKYSTDPSYTKYDENEDMMMMQDIVESEPHLLFDEVMRDYDQLFISKDEGTLRAMYNDAMSEVRKKCFENYKEYEQEVADCG